MNSIEDMPPVIRERVVPAAPIEITSPAERALWRRGYRDHDRGRRRKDCPHRKARWIRIWHEGWDAAEAAGEELGNG